MLKLELNFEKIDIKLLMHFVTALNQCLGREGNLAWEDSEFRARLWEAVDRGEIKTKLFQKHYKNFTVVVLKTKTKLK
jgi:hypothetical protein